MAAVSQIRNIQHWPPFSRHILTGIISLKSFDIRDTPFSRWANVSSIASRDTAPWLPHLERLSISILARVDRVLNCADAFARLASALVGPDGSGSTARGTRRYPAFCELTLRVMKAVPRPTVEDEPGVVYDAERAFYEQITDGRVLLRPMFEGFVRAGVHVNIEVT